MSSDRELRQRVQQAVTDALAPTLRTRAFVFNTLMADKSTDDRLRKYPTWISSRNLANEASDESVQALVDAVRGAYDIPQRWYRLKARLLGLDRLKDYDRMAPVAGADESFDWDEARQIVLDSFGDFSPMLAEHVEGSIATVFRQVAMNRFEELAHTARRTEGELSMDRLGDLWAQSQEELLADSVEVTDNYRSWWSYVPHFIGTPGYVYAYAYGQLLALSVYGR